MKIKTKRFEEFLTTIKINEDMDLPYFGNFLTFIREREDSKTMWGYLDFLYIESQAYRLTARHKGTLESFQQWLDRCYPAKNVIYPTITEVEV